MAQAVGGKALGGEAREAGERARLTPFAVRAQRRGAASTAFCRKEKPFRNREITGAGLDLSPASRADRALATDSHGLRLGLSSIARCAGSPAFGLAPWASRRGDPPASRASGSCLVATTLLGEEPKKRVTSDELNNSSLVTRHLSLVTCHCFLAAAGRKFSSTHSSLLDPS